MTLDRLEWHLENWRDDMGSQGIFKRLGYPSKSLGIASGGDSAADEFEIMCEDCDKESANTMDGIIESLSRPQHTAVYYHWRLSKHFYPTQDLDYEEAKENIIRIAKKRGLY
jgi:hypothetical protein